MDKYKKEIAKIINEISLDEGVKSQVLKYIENYDGQNKNDFQVLCEIFVDLLCIIKDLKVKADGFDAIKELNISTDMQMQSLKKEYDDLKNETLAPGPPVSTSLLQDN